jgi:hypothetical protein
MAEAEVITAVGRNNKPINVGDVVNYVNTDTISRVSEIKEDEQGVWVLLEATNLWYRDETLEPTDIELKEKKEEKELTAKEMEERIRRGKEDMAAFDLSKTTGGGAGG